jgi:arabinogalactan endo-1,4-beta-galactosidase
MLDFHYSDWWADPQQQNKPAAWKDLSFADLQTALHDYSRDVVKALVDQGTPAEVVQPGNEITNGMLWPDGKIEINKNGWQRLSLLLKAAVAGIREGGGATNPKIMIHLDQGGDNDVSRIWLDNYFKTGGELDIIGLSYYPQWHGTLPELERNLHDLVKRYGKDVMVAETGFPYASFQRRPAAAGAPAAPPGANQQPASTDPTAVTGYPASPQGQLDYLKRLISIVRGAPHEHGVGVLWWAPAQIPPPGRNFGGGGGGLFDNNGEALPAFFAFSSNHS